MCPGLPALKPLHLALLALATLALVAPSQAQPLTPLEEQIKAQKLAAEAEAIQRMKEEAIEAAMAKVQPNNSVVTVNSQKFEVKHLPMLAPVEHPLAPDRWKNFHPVATFKEAIAEGAVTMPPTLAPERDCVKEPQKLQCSCKEMISGCSDQAYKCDVVLQEEAKLLPEALRNNFYSKHQHPMLTTFAQRSQRSRRLRRGSRAAQTPQDLSVCRACVGELVDEARQEAPRDLALLQRGRDPDWAGPSQGFEPSDFGWRIFEGAPTWESDRASKLERKLAKMGACTLPEVDVLNDCLSYFFECDSNRQSVAAKIHQLNNEAEWIDSHPGTRPEVWSPNLSG